MPLTSAQIEAFIEEGLVRVDAALPAELVDAAARRVWSCAGLSPDEPQAWPAGAIKVGELADRPEADLLDGLGEVYDQLVGVGRWRPFGKVPDVRLAFQAGGDPSPWHVDVADSEGGDPLDPFSWRVSLASKGFGLLVVALLSDVPEAGAATVLRKGSHRALATRLAASPPEGVVLRELMKGGFPESAEAPRATMWGPAGTVFLCHPFMVHAALPNRSPVPRIHSVGALETEGPWAFEGAKPPRAVPVEEAVWRALQARREPA